MDRESRGSTLAVNLLDAPSLPAAAYKLAQLAQFTLYRLT